jgi:KDO2-lipid IV(A) lauroyltransferase
MSGAATPSARTPSPHRRVRVAAGRWALGLAVALMDGVSRGLRLLPPAARYGPGDAVSGLLAPLWARPASLATRNFALMLGRSPHDPRVRALARRSVRNFARMAIDFLVVRTLRPAEIRALVAQRGEEHLAEALRGGRGAIFALPHVGSWDVAAAFFPVTHGPLTVITESDWAADLVAGSRRNQGVTLVSRDRSLRAVIRALARNECVAILSDMAKEGLQVAEVPFFGRSAPFPLGPARLARRTGAPILVVGCVRLSDDAYRVEAQPPLRADPGRAAGEDARALTAAIAAGFERIIAAYPDQWYPFHRIWPHDAPDP